MVMIKVCGIREENIVMNAEPDFFGFIVLTPDSRRNITLERAQYLMKISKENVKNVLVTRNCHLDNLVKLDSLHPDYIQIHFPMNSERLEKIKKLLNAGIVAFVDRSNVDQIKEIQMIADFIISDTSLNGISGGTGKENNWDFVADMRSKVERGKLIASGGIKTDNMKKVFEITKADVLDASSGLENGGKKDLKLVKEFIAVGRSLK